MNWEEPKVVDLSDSKNALVSVGDSNPTPPIIKEVTRCHTGGKASGCGTGAYPGVTLPF